MRLESEATLNNVINFPSKESGLEIQGATISGDERIVAWFQAAAGIASALGIHVQLRGAFTAHAMSVRPLPTMADLKKAESD